MVIADAFAPQRTGSAIHSPHTKSSYTPTYRALYPHGQGSGASYDLAMSFRLKNCATDRSIRSA